MKFTDKKIVVSGPYVEVNLYNGDVHAYDFSIPKTYKEEKIIPENETKSQKQFRLEQEKLIKFNNRKKSMLKAKTTVTRLINSNIWQWYKEDGRPYIPIFLTLTFKEDVKDLPTANYIFNKFIKRLNYEVIGEKKGFLQYVAVSEYQDKTRKGVIHYHIVFFNLKFIYADTMASIWGEGFIKIKKIGKVKDIASYLTKYMVKDFSDDRMDRKKRYFSSHNLFKPQTFLDQTHTKWIYEGIPKKYLVKEGEYWGKYDGQIKTQIFLLPRRMDVEDIIRSYHDYHD